MRNRLIKAEFWTDEELGELPRDVRLLFIGLWTYADDWGRLEERPQKIRVALFPYDLDITPQMVTDWLDHLVTARKLVRYEVDGQRYLFVRRFFTHQQMRRHKRSDLPPPPGDDGLLQPTSSNEGDAPTSADIDGQSPHPAADFPPIRADRDKDRDKDRDSPYPLIVRQSQVPPVLKPPPRPKARPARATPPEPAMSVEWTGILAEFNAKTTALIRRRIGVLQAKADPPQPDAIRAALREGQWRAPDNPVNYALGILRSNPEFSDARQQPTRLSANGAGHRGAGGQIWATVGVAGRTREDAERDFADQWERAGRGEH